MARISGFDRTRTAVEVLQALRLAAQVPLVRESGDCRVWAAVYLGRDGRILLAPVRLRSGIPPPGYSACLRLLLRLLRSRGFPSGLMDGSRALLYAGRYRRL